MPERIKFHGSYKDVTEPAVLSLGELEVALAAVEAVETTALGFRNFGYSQVVKALCIEFKNEPTSLCELSVFLGKDPKSAGYFSLCRQVNGAWKRRGVRLKIVPGLGGFKSDWRKKIQVWRK